MTARYEEAISDFTKTIKYYPSFSPGYFWRGRSYNEIKKIKEALSDFDRAIELDPENAEYYSHRGSVYYNNRKIYGLDEAERDSRKACELGDNLACHLLQLIHKMY